MNGIFRFSFVCSLKIDFLTSYVVLIALMYILTSLQYLFAITMKQKDKNARWNYGLEPRPPENVIDHKPDGIVTPQAINAIHSYDNVIVITCDITMMSNSYQHLNT